MVERHTSTSRHTQSESWLRFTRLCMPMVVPSPASGDEAPVKQNRRWKRSLCATMVFRAMQRVLRWIVQRTARSREVA